MSVFIRFLKESKREWTCLGVLVVVLMGAALFEVMAPRILGHFVDAIVHGLSTGEHIATVIDASDSIILTLIALYGAHAICTYIGEYIMSGVAERLVLAVRDRLSDHLYHLPMAYVGARNRGDLLSRLISDLDTVRETLREGIPGLISSLIGIVGALTMMIIISPILALIIIGVIAVGILCLTLTSRWARRIFLRNQEALGAFNGGVEEVISGKAVVEAFGLEGIMTAKLKGLNETLFKRERQSGFLGQIIMPLVNFMNQLGYVLVAIQGGLLVLRGQISIGEIQAFFLYVTQVSDPISRSSYILTKFQETQAALGRVYEILDRPCEVDDGVAMPAEPMEGRIDFKDVSFGYTDDALLMDKVNFTIPGGSLVAIVGPTGAGKTTIVNLIMRFFEIQGGAIMLDGTDIRTLSRHSLHSTIGMVLQDAWIMTGSIADNIAYGKPEATRDEIIHVAKLAMADHFIRTLPQGYDTILKNGADDLSQGQRQLITIARAFLMNPSVLILDEATANVDTRTEVEVQKAMAQLLKGRTGIVIAHRLSTIRDADLLLVVNQGRIVERGTHEELLEAGGYYTELYRNYAQGMSV